MMNKNNIPNIPAEKFRFVGDETVLHDQKMDTKQVSYFRDAFNRFCKNKGSVTAAIIILALILYSIFVPIFCTTSYSAALTDTKYLAYTKLLPKNQWFADMGIEFWDGGSNETISQALYLSYAAIAEETGFDIFIGDVSEPYVNLEGKTLYDVRLDSYIANGYKVETFSDAEYKALQQWQNETGIQVLYPMTTDATMTDSTAGIWYKADKKGTPQLDKNGNFQAVYKLSGNDGGYNSLRIEGDPGLEDPEASNRYRYANPAGTSTAPEWKCRVFKYTYFQYRYGFEPAFLLGTTGQGQDMLTRLANAAQFSLVFAVIVSVINLTIGAIIGAIEGYYGGMVDMLMERFIDILARVPFMVVASLFQLHLRDIAGPVGSMLFAFVLTGWIGMAGTVRMQFYRYKGQEYVLASRVLGASDWRIMFRHIFPNSLGTIITSSVLVIPGVIFSESSLTYLGIVNLESSTSTSVGTMLANGRAYLANYPHIILFPALFISLLMITFNLFGNGLRDAFNPSLRGADE